MSYSKHAHLRYNILDQFFRNKAFDFEQLLIALNRRLETYYSDESVSKRTLRNDLKIFREKVNGFDAPIPPKARILKYDNPNFSIAKRPLLEYEQYLIDAAQQLLERFENDPKYDRLSEALIKFQDEEDPTTDSNQILFYDHNDEYKGIKYLKPMYLAIKNKKVLDVEYRNFRQETSIFFEFHPHILKQYNRRWFVYGLNSTDQKKEWSIPLDERLIRFDFKDEVDYIKSDTDWDSFFRSMVGIVRHPESKVEHVVLKFYNGREDYFKTKPFHPDYDMFMDEEKEDQVYFDSILNKELVQQILSYGGDVEVLEPQTLIDMVKEHVESLKEHYK